MPEVRITALVLSTSVSDPTDGSHFADFANRNEARMSAQIVRVLDASCAGAVTKKAAVRPHPRRAGLPL